MTEHDLGYFRSVAKYAFRDWTVNTGQLEALTCKSAMETKRYPRVKKREIKLAGHSVCRITDPVKVTETRLSGREIPLIEYQAYFYCHERRVIRQLAEHQRSWILYCYCHEMNFQHQVNICSYLWRKFTYQTADIKITKKVKERLKILVWLCAQQCADSFSGLANQGYSQSDLAKLMGMKRDNWKKNYHHFWLRLISICKALDREALCQIAESV